MKITKAKVKAFMEISMLMAERGYSVSDRGKTGPELRFEIAGKDFKKFLTPGELFALLRNRRPKKMSHRDFGQRMKELNDKARAGLLSPERHSTEVLALQEEYSKHLSERGAPPTEKKK